MRIIDLTQKIMSNMPVYPGSEPVTLKRTADIEKEGYNEIRMIISTHTGTHIDCPGHIIKEGPFLDELSPEKFYGKGCVADCTRLIAGERLSIAFFKNYEEILIKNEFLILFTGWDRFWGSSDYFEKYPLPDLEAAEYLTKFSLKGIGIDAPGFDPVNSPDFPLHKQFLSNGMVLIENLTGIDRLPLEGFDFLCLPLNIKQGDGSPVRAVAVTS